MKRILLSALILLALPRSLSAQVAEEKVNRCALRVLPAANALTMAVPEFALNLRGSRGTRLVYVGIQRVYDSLDVQVRQIESAWRDAVPTIAFYEGAESSMGVSPSYSAQKYGLSALVRSLAQRAGIEARSLDPSRAEEASHLLKKFKPDQVATYLALRTPVEIRETRGVTGPPLEDSLRVNVDRVAQVEALQGVFANVAAFKQAYARTFGGEPTTGAQAAWFDPAKTSPETGGRYLNEVARESRLFRDQYALRQIAAEWKPGARIFAITTKERVPSQAPALRCGLGG